MKDLHRLLDGKVEGATYIWDNTLKSVRHQVISGIYSEVHAQLYDRIIRDTRQHIHRRIK